MTVTPLGIITPQIGTRSETFIRRHIERLLPQGTAVTARCFPPPYGGHWTVEGPFYQIPDRAGLRRIVRGTARRLGIRPDLDRERAVRFFCAQGVETVMAQYLDQSLPWLEIVRKAGLRFFAHAHGYDVSERLREAHWQAEYRRYNQADGVITMSRSSRDRLTSLGLEPEKVHCIPYGVDIPAQPAAHSERAQVHCVAIGSMVGKKAPLLTLEAFRRAQATCPQLRLDFVGTGPLLPAAQEYVRAHRLGESVHLHGGQPHDFVKQRLSESDIFLQHSIVDPESGDEEGLPVAVLEAMSYGLPVVSTRHAGIPEAVCEGQTGLLVAEKDVEGMAVRLITLACDPDLRRRMGEGGRRRAQEEFSWEKERRSLLTLLGLERFVEESGA